jgi:hypothetical protein
MTKKAGTRTPSARWLLLVHQLPSKPAYSRVKIWRGLQDIGAISLRNSVYILPSSAEARSQFTQLLKEIERNRGDGLLYEADLVAGMRDDQVRALFNAARDADYNTLGSELRQLAQAWKKAKKPKADPVAALARLSERLSQLGEIDFFGASGRRAAEALLAELEHSAIARTNSSTGKPAPLRPAEMTGKVWVTRRDIHVDRIACAWLIKRFIDPNAVLKFVPTKHYEPQANEFRYDMQDGEFTHEGNRCSFETLLARYGRSDSALQAIAEIIHDIDLKDGRYGRAETTGIAHVISGICRTQGDDGTRVARGAELFDHIYEQFRRRRK